MKQTKRTFFVLLLCGALLLGAAGCGKSETPEDSSGDTSTNSAIQGVGVDLQSGEFLSGDFVCTKKEDGIAILSHMNTDAMHVNVPQEIDGLPVVQLGGGDGFGKDHRLESITLPEGLKRISDGCFTHCHNLHTVTIPATVTEIGSAPFFRASSLTEIKVASGSKSFKAVDGVLYDMAGETLISFPEGKVQESFYVPDSVKVIRNGAFGYHPQIKHLYLTRTVQLEQIPLTAYGSDLHLYVYKNSPADKLLQTYDEPDHPYSYITESDATFTTTGAPTSRNTSRTKTICPTAPPRSTTTTGRTTTTTTTTTAATTTTTTRPPQPEVETQWVLPQVVRQTGGRSGQYLKVIYTADGRILAVGRTDTDGFTSSIIDVYDENLVLLDTYTENLMGYYDILPCRDGGFLVFQNAACEYFQKFSSDLTPEWNLYLVDLAENMWATSMIQLTDGTFAVVYRKHMMWYLALFTEDGRILTQQDLQIHDIGFEDPTLIADEEGGFYLVIGVDPEDTDAPVALRQALDPKKGREVAIAHYVTDADSWSIDSVQTVGGLGDDWCEEAAMDEEGNFYIALGMHDTIDDPFWDEVTPHYFFRRMLVKVNAAGEVVYRIALSGRAMGLDQVFGIHVRDGQACVTGISAFYDGVLDPYEADAWPEADKYDLYAAYAVLVNEDGNLLSRRVFRYSSFEIGEPGESVWLPDGRLLMCGAVCREESDFDLDFAADTHSNRALFIY